MSLKSKIVSIKKFPKESCISYGRKFKTSIDKSIIVVVSTGYADGYWRALSNRGHVLINGEPAPIVGTICMDCFMVDLTEVAGEIYEGQEVILMGRSGNRELTADMLADLCKTISYEIVCRVGKRVDRVYV